MVVWLDRLQPPPGYWYLVQSHPCWRCGTILMLQIILRIYYRGLIWVELPGGRCGAELSCGVAPLKGAQNNPAMRRKIVPDFIPWGRLWPIIGVYCNAHSHLSDRPTNGKLNFSVTYSINSKFSSLIIVLRTGQETVLPSLSPKCHYIIHTSAAFTKLQF